MMTELFVMLHGGDVCKKSISLKSKIPKVFIDKWAGKICENTNDHPDNYKQTLKEMIREWEAKNER